MAKLFVETILIVPSYLRRLMPMMANICTSPRRMPDIDGHRLVAELALETFLFTLLVLWSRIMLPDTYK